MISISLSELSTFLFISWFIFLALSGVALLAPLEDWKSNTLFMDFYMVNALSWRDNLLRHMKQSQSSYQAGRLFFHASSVAFVSYWKEVTLIGLAIQFSPTLKGSF
jgi:hypothetical protein